MVLCIQRRSIKTAKLLWEMGHRNPGKSHTTSHLAGRHIFTLCSHVLFQQY